jgi:hypothetical protein
LTKRLQFSLAMGLALTVRAPIITFRPLTSRRTFMFGFASKIRGSRRRTVDRKSCLNRLRHSRRLAVEHLERRELLAVTPMAPVTFGGADSFGDAGHAVAIDEANNRYLVGVFSGVVDFDLGPGVSELTSNGDLDIFVAKYNADGSLAWARGFGSQYQDSASDWRQSIAVDASGHVYVLTSFANTVAFDNIVLSSVGPSGQPAWKSNVVLCLDPNGAVAWAESFGDSTYAMGLAVYSDPGAAVASSVYVAGGFWATQFFGGQQLSPTGYGGRSESHDGFLSRLDATTGEFSWTKQTTEKVNEWFTNVAIDDASALYVSGRKGDYAMVAKASLDGEFQWTKLVATGKSTGLGTVSEAWGIAADGGKIYVAGWFHSQYANFGTIRITNAGGKFGGSDIFVTALDGSGNFLWARGVGSTAADTDNIFRRPTIAADSLGSVFLAGVLGAQAQLGADFLPAGHFVSQIDAADGQFVKNWSLGAGVQSRNINTDPAGNLWVTGLFEGTVTFPDGTTVTSNNGSQDVFLQQFSQAPAASPASMQTIASADKPTAIRDSAILLDAASVDQLYAERESTWTRKSRAKLIAI